MSVFAGPVTGVIPAESTGVTDSNSNSGESPTEASNLAASTETEGTAIRRNSVYDASTLFDGGGIPLLTVSQPLFISLQPTTGGGSSGGGSLIQNDVVVGLVSGPGGGTASIGNVGPSLGSGEIIQGLTNTVASVPEPATLLLLAPGLAMGLAWRRRVRRGK